MDLVETDQIALISNLLVGEGAEDFRQLERISDKFCPFEAIGMVGQEIRHSKFLSYILDENRPHVFGAHVLEELLGIVAERTASFEGGFSPLDLHFMDVSNSFVQREWRNIDLLVEIPVNKTLEGKGIIIAIELKIHASESPRQLKKYQKIIESEYPANDWEQILVFLTLNEDDPSQDEWIPVGLSELIHRLERMVTTNDFQGQSVELLKSYISMMRKNFMSNKELKTLASKIWSKHKEALDTLYFLEPDLRGEAMEILYENRVELAKRISNETGYELVSEKSDYSIIRFGVLNWDNFKAMSSGDGKWLDSSRLLAIEVGMWGESVRASYVIGPGDETNREKLFKRVLKKVDDGTIKIGRKTPVSATQYKHLSADYLILKRKLEEAAEKEVDAADIASKIEKALVRFLNRTLPVYDKIISKAF